MEFGEEHGGGRGLLAEGLRGFVDGFGFYGGRRDLGVFDAGSDVEMGIDEGAVEVVLDERGVGVFGEIGSNWKDVCGELLIEAVKESADMVHFGIDGIL